MTRARIFVFSSQLCHIPSKYHVIHTESRVSSCLCLTFVRLDSITRVVVILVSHSRYADFCRKIGMPQFEITVNAYLPYLIALIQAAIASTTPGMNSSIA